MSPRVHHVTLLDLSWW